MHVFSQSSISTLIAKKSCKLEIISEMGQYLLNLTYAVPLLVEGESSDSGNVTRTSLYFITHPTSALLSPTKIVCDIDINCFHLINVERDTAIMVQVHWIRSKDCRVVRFLCWPYITAKVLPLSMSDRETYVYL